MGLTIGPSSDKDRVNITGGGKEAKGVKIYSFSGKLEKPGKLLQKAAVFFGFAEKIKDSQSKKEYYVNIRSLGKHIEPADTYAPLEQGEGNKMEKALAKVRDDVKAYFDNYKRGFDFLEAARKRSESERSQTYAAALRAHQAASIGTDLGPTLTQLESEPRFAGIVDNIKNKVDVRDIDYSEFAAKNTVEEAYKEIQEVVTAELTIATSRGHTSPALDTLREFFAFPRSRGEQASVLRSIDNHFGINR